MANKIKFPYGKDHKPSQGHGEKLWSGCSRHCNHGNACRRPPVNRSDLSGFIDGKEKIDVTMGGMRFSYSRKGHHNRCDYVCGGFAGLHKSGRWSTWSPGRCPISDRDEDFQTALLNAVGPYLNRPKRGSFVIIEHPDGTREAVTAEEAKKHLAAMPPEQKALYE